MGCELVEHEHVVTGVLLQGLPRRLWDFLAAILVSGAHRCRLGKPCNALSLG